MFRVVCEMHGEGVETSRVVLTSRKPTVTLPEHIHLHRHKRPNKHPLPDIKLPPTSQQQRPLDIFLDNLAILAAHDLGQVSLYFDPCASGDAGWLDDPPVLGAEVLGEIWRVMFVEVED